jgi:hypothetical protein
MCCCTVVAQKKSNNSATHHPFHFTTFTGGVVVVRAQLVGYSRYTEFYYGYRKRGHFSDSTTCIRLNITPVLTDKLIMGIGGVRQLRYVNDRSLKLGTLQIDSLNFHVSDYDILSSV